MAGLEVFVGRAVLLRTLATGLAQGRSFTLCGGPKTGRTSTLLQLVHLARQRRGASKSALKIVPVYLDLATAPADRPHVLVGRLWQAIKDAVLDPYVQQHPTPPRPGSADPARSQQPWTVLQELLSSLWEGLANTPGWCRTVLLLDNADVLTPGAWQGGDATLAALLDGVESWRPMAQVVAGGATWARTVGRSGSPWHRLRPQGLGVLREADVHVLLKAGGLGAVDAGWAVTASGKHPQVLQCLLAAWQGGGGDPEHVIAQAKPAIERTFATLHASFPPLHPARGDVPLEHALMRLLIDHGVDLPARDAEHQLRRGPIKAASDFLEQAAVVERSVRGSVTVLRAGCALWNAYYSAQP